MNCASLRLWQYVALCGVDSSANTAESSSSSRQGHGSMWYCALTRLQTLQGPAAAAGKDITERHEEPGRRSLGCILLSRTQRAAVHFVLSRGYCDVRACPLAKWAFPSPFVFMHTQMHARRHMHVCTCNAVFKHASTGPCVQPEQLEERLHHTRAGAGVVLPADMALLHVESGQVMCQCTHVTVDSCDRLTVTTHLKACGARAYSAIRGGNLQDIYIARIRCVNLNAPCSTWRAGSHYIAPGQSR